MNIIALAYFTRGSGKPLKLYSTTRNFSTTSITVNQPYAQEHVCIISGFRNQIQRLAESGGSFFSSQPFNFASLDRDQSYNSRMCGNKLLRWRGKRLHTSAISLTNNRLDERSTAVALGSDISYLNSVLDAEAIPGYTFKLLYDGKLVVGDRMEFDLNAAITTDINNNANFPRLTVLDYPTNFVPDPAQTEEQQLASLRETIVRTRLLIYTTDGKGHIVSFTRDATETGVIPLNYEPVATDNSPAFALTTTDTEQLETLGNILSDVDNHLLRGVDSTSNVNGFGSRVPIYVKVETIDLALGDAVRGIQVDRDSNKLWVLNIREVGDPRVPTGNNTIFDMDLFIIDKSSGLTIVRTARTTLPIKLPTFSPKNWLLGSTKCCNSNNSISRAYAYGRCGKCVASRKFGY